MAETKDDGGYWLPAHFLTDDDFLIDRENLTKDSIHSLVREDVNTPKGHYDPFFSSPALNSPVESIVSSTETESERDEFLAEFSRQLAESSFHGTCNFNCGPGHGARAFCSNRDSSAKSRVLGSSPDSTLSGFGGWCERNHRNGLSQVSSPTSLLGVNPDAWERIYAAAGQVARLKINAQLQQNRGLIGPPRNYSPVAKTPDNGGFQTVRPQYSQLNQIQQVKQPAGSIWGLGPGKEEGWYCPQMQTRGSNGGCVGTDSGSRGGAYGQSAWPPLRGHHLQHPHSGGSDMRAVVLDGSVPVVKKKSTGTGVFLPRRPSETRKKSGCCSTVLLPTRVVQALNLNLEEMAAPTQPCFPSGYIPDHDFLMARRNALLAQQKQRMLMAEGARMMTQETRLPQDWTY